MLQFKSTYDLEEFTTKTLRFNFNDKAGKITLINSYAARIIILNYSDILSVCDYQVNNISVLRLDCVQDTSIYFVTQKDKIKDLIKNSSYSCKNIKEKTHQIAEHLFIPSCEMSNISINNYIILSSQSNFDKNVEKLKLIARN